MKKIAIKLIILLAPLLVIYAVLESRIASIPNSYNTKRALLEKQLNNIEVLCTGSSQALYAINPAYFSHTGFSLAYVSQTLYYDIRETERYADKMPKLKVLIVPVNILSFYTQLHGGQIEEWRDYFYLHFWGITYKNLPWLDMRRYSLVPLYGRDEVVGFIKAGFHVNKAPAYNACGYVKSDSTGHLVNINDSTGAVRAAYHNAAFNMAETPYIVNDLEGLLKFAQSRHITVAFIAIPVYHTYSDHIDRNMLKCTDSIVNSLCAKYSCTYYNHFFDGRFNHNIDYFADNDHQSIAGAARFSSILDSEIVRPAFQR